MVAAPDPCLIVVVVASTCTRKTRLRYTGMLHHDDKSPPHPHAHAAVLEQGLKNCKCDS